MPIAGLPLALEVLHAPLPIRRGTVTTDEWQSAAALVAQQGGRLVALWGTQLESGANRFVISAAYASADGLTWLDLPLPDGSATYPDLSGDFRYAVRLQRAVHDLLGIAAEQGPDTRPWLDHGAWPIRTPLRVDGGAPATIASPQDGASPQAGDYAFVRVEGDGVHEIPVGPVHAGIIEPGHFRFSVVGEKLLRLEERLGYTHKGIERRFTELAPLEAWRLAGRVSGDSTVAYAWAWCMALESAVGCDIPERARWLRALMLERERVANHLGDLGALGNDAALAFALSQFSRLREDWQRLSMTAFGHRLMMDAIAPGGVAADVGAAAPGRIAAQCDAVEVEVKRLRAIFDEHAGLQDRFLTTGRVSPQLAAQMGLTGLAGRASGQSADLRVDHPCPPYDQLEVKAPAHLAGDVAARVAVRFDETIESLRLIREICSRLPRGATRSTIDPPATAAAGAGWVEGWRGEIFVALDLDDRGRIRRCHCHDPSWQNWPVLEHAVIGNIVPDFPLINKSFNLSYSGHDL